MSVLPSFEEMHAGKNCPFCLTRPDVNEYTFKVADLAFSTLYLERNQLYRGYCILQFNKRHVTGIELLTADEFLAFSHDLRRAARAIAEVVAPDHMNYATLGNVIPHLHYHIIPRYRNDPRWGAPIWETSLEAMPVKKLQNAEYQELISGIQKVL